LGSLWEILKGCKKAAGKCPNTCNQPIGEEGEFPSGYRQERGNFHLFYLKGPISVFIFLKSKGAVKFFLNAQQLFSHLVLSNHTTFSQTQTGATVPLRTLRYVGSNAPIGTLVEMFRDLMSWPES
jgi:hypothetical protein